MIKRDITKYLTEPTNVGGFKIEQNSRGQKELLTETVPVNLNKLVDEEKEEAK